VPINIRKGPYRYKPNPFAVGWREWTFVRVGRVFTLNEQKACLSL